MRHLSEANASEGSRFIEVLALEDDAQPESPESISWGGYFWTSISADQVTECYNNHEGDVKDTSKKNEEYFYPAVFNDFAARMEWAATGSGNRNPIVKINGKPGRNPLIVETKEESKFEIDASMSEDPDNNSINYKWWIIPESIKTKSGSPLRAAKYIQLEGEDEGKVSVRISKGSGIGEFQIVCEVTDDGSIPLTSYRRVIVNL